MAFTLKRGPKTPERDPNDLTVDLYDWPDPRQPSAVLVPPVVIADRKARKARKGATLTAAVVTSVAVVASGATWFLASQSADELQVAQSEVAAATARVQKYYAVATYYDGLMSQQQALSDRLADDLTYSRMVGEVLGAKSRELSLERFEVQPGVACPGPNPFEATTTIGCIQLAGKGNIDDIASFVDNLNAIGAEDGLTGAFVHSVSKQGADLGFSASVSYTTAFLSDRFTLTTPEAAGTDQTVPETPAGENP